MIFGYSWTQVSILVVLETNESPVFRAGVFRADIQRWYTLTRLKVRYSGILRLQLRREQKFVF